MADDIAGDYTGRALDAANEGIASVINYFDDSDEKKKEAVRRAQRVARLRRRDEES